MFLLENAHVGCVGGFSFGSPECIRFSYAASEEELREAMKRIKTYWKNSINKLITQNKTRQQ